MENPTKQDVASKDALFTLGKPPTEIVTLPELGEGMQVVVRGFTVGQMATIRNAAATRQSDGTMRYDSKQDRVLSFIAAMQDPPLSFPGDAELVEGLNDAIADRVIGTALRLSCRTESSYDDLKEVLRQNPLIQRLYSVCVNKLGRLPSELADVPESEFMAALAALEIDAEALEEELKTLE
jgi:hypothetical protein